MTTNQYLEVTLPNGTVATKKATRNFTHALVTDREVVSWHTSENTAHRALYRKVTHTAESLRIERTRVAS